MKLQYPVAPIAGALAFLTALPGAAALQVGAAAPVFIAPASLDGETFTFSLARALAQGPVVVYFFPAAYTRGCDREAHTFSVHMAEFKAAGASVIGVSADSNERLDEFSADPDFCAGKFPIASDPQGAIAARYGLEMIPARSGLYDVRGNEITRGFLPRVTFVLNAQGRVVERLSSADDDLTADQHATRSLAIVRQLQTPKN